MSKHRVVVLKITAGQLSVTEAAEKYGISRRHLHRLLARFHEGGIEAVDPQSRRPQSNPRATPPEVTTRIIELRSELTTRGFDAGPVTIRWHLEQEGITAPSNATIHRTLTRAGLVTPEPRKRPKSSYIRFEASQPNETWQSDFTHWHLADGTDIEILNWLDDHARFLLSCTPHTPVTGDDVVTTFLETTEKYGVPASTLTDNGRVYTARFGGGRNAFEHLLPILSVKQKNGKPGHPQTQGKVERFHQTQKKWLARQPPAESVTELQTQLDQFRNEYNEQRPHRALNRQTPSHAYAATPKALPGPGKTPDQYRLRYDHVDTDGHASLRRAGRMHHLGIGAAHRGKRILIITDKTTATVTHLDTGEILSEHHNDPTRSYWRNTLKPPGRWPQK